MKNVLITGAAGGIGEATSLLLAQNGYNVGIHCHSSVDKANLIKSRLLPLGVDAEIFIADLSKRNDCFALADSFIARFGSIDVLINNAGISKIADITATACEEFEKIIATNLSAPFYLSKALLPSFLAAKQGSIINISSVWGVNGASCEVAYSASKSGLIGFTKALAKELAPSGINVNAVAPGFIDTPMNSEIDCESVAEIINDIPLGRLGTPNDVAKAVLFLASDSASYITGQCLTVDGGWI